LPRNADELSVEIRRYCAAHPNAVDTIEGIAWWLALQRYDDALREVRDCIDKLVRDGVLVHYQTEHGVSVFGCRPADMQTPAS
jgi:hypothetical protein